MKWFRSLWRDVWNWVLPAPTIWKTAEVEELPEVLNVRVIYLVGEKGYLWFVAFVCPCGCAETIFLNLLPDQRPCWSIERHSGGRISLSPSIWRIQKCRSHFFIRRSQIEWCLSSLS